MRKKASESTEAINWETQKSVTKKVDGLDFLRFSNQQEKTSGDGKRPNDQ
jgi:hypothetical protein